MISTNISGQLELLQCFIYGNLVSVSTLNSLLGRTISNKNAVLAGWDMFRDNDKDYVIRTQSNTVNGIRLYLSLHELEIVDNYLLPYKRINAIQGLFGKYDVWVYTKL